MALKWTRQSGTRERGRALVDLNRQEVIIEMKCGVKLISCFFLNVARAMWGGGVSVRTYAYDKCYIDLVQGQYRAEYLHSRLRRSGRYSPVLALYEVNYIRIGSANVKRA